MTEIYIICEGATEQTFIAEVLAPELESLEIYLYPRIVGVNGHRGGNIGYQRMVTDIKILQDYKKAYCSTFFDFYGLDSKFPGMQEATSANKTIEEKQKIIMQGFKNELKKDKKIDPTRFIPYVQMYEFEGLLFSDPSKLAKRLNLDPSDFQKIRKEFSTPEEINNSKFTAPSKRIVKLCGSYDKVVHGNLAALDIGISTILKECKLFAQWVEQLKSVKELT